MDNFSQQATQAVQHSLYKCDSWQDGLEYIRQASQKFDFMQVTEECPKGSASLFSIIQSMMHEAWHQVLQESLAQNGGQLPPWVSFRPRVIERFEYLSSAVDEADEAKQS